MFAGFSFTFIGMFICIFMYYVYFVGFVFLLMFSSYFIHLYVSFNNYIFTFQFDGCFLLLYNFNIMVNAIFK